MKNLPAFFNYTEENTDSGYETVQDFFISWTLRCATDNIEFQSNLNKYSKKILLNLIFDDKIPESVKIISVKTKRQWKLIDLLVEVKTEINNKSECFILNIENKWYTSVRKGQLEKSKKAVETEYSNNKFKLINLIIIPDFEKFDDTLKSILENSDYKIKVIEEIRSKVSMNKKTGNYLFDEYWFKFYE